MLKKLEVLEDKYKELTEKISDPEIINDQKTWQKYMKEHADLMSLFWMISSSPAASPT